MGANTRNTPPGADAASRRGRWAQAFGYDVFISYNRAEATPYAVALHRMLGAAGLVCFLDDHETAPGLALTPTIERALRRSRVLVLVASPAALRSPWVGRELLTYSVLHRPIIPISVQGALKSRTADGTAFDLLAERDVAWLDEAPSISAQDPPSEAVVKRVRSFFGFRRSAMMLRGAVLGVCLGLAGLGALAWREARQAVDNEAATVVQAARVRLQSGQAREAVEQLLQALDRPWGRSALLEEQLHDSLAWAVSQWAPLITHPAAGAVGRVQYTPDGTALVAALEGTGLAIYRSGQAAAQSTIPFPGSGTTFELDSAGAQVLAGSGVGQAALYDIASGRLVLSLASAAAEGRDRADRALAFLPDGSPVTGSEDGVVRVWRRSDGSLLRRFVLAAATPPAGDVPRPPVPGVSEATGSEGVLALAVSADGQLLAAGGREGAVNVWRLREGHASVLDVRVEGSVHDLVFDAAGEFIALSRHAEERTSYSQVTGKGVVEIRRIKDGAKQYEREFPDSYPSLAAVASTRCLYIRTQQVSTAPFGAGAPACAEHSVEMHKGVSGFAVDRDGARLATTDSDGTIELWSTQPWKLLFRIASGARTSGVGPVAFHPLVPRLAVGGRPLAIWNIDRFRVPSQQTLGGRIEQVAPDGSAVLVQDEHRQWALHLRGEAQPRATFGEELLGAVRAASFSPDSRQFILVGHRVSAWDTRSGARLHEWSTEVPEGAGRLDLHFDRAGPSFALSGGITQRDNEEVWIFSPDAAVPLMSSAGPFRALRDFRDGRVAISIGIGLPRVELYQLRPWTLLFRQDTGVPAQALRIAADGQSVMLLHANGSSKADAQGVRPVNEALWGSQAPGLAVLSPGEPWVPVAEERRTALWGAESGRFLLGVEGVDATAAGTPERVVVRPEDRRELSIVRVATGAEVQQLQACTGYMKPMPALTAEGVLFTCPGEENSLYPRAVVYGLPLLPQGDALVTYTRELLR